MRKALALLFTLLLAVGLLTGCGGGGGDKGGEKAAATKKMIVGDTTFTPDNLEKTINPHDEYSGWACIRYGVGETLVRYSDKMEVEPWLATSWKNVDPLTWELTLKDGVKFHSGRAMDAAAVKECLEALVKNHDRAPKDLMIDSIEANDQKLTIKTKEPRPALLHSLGGQLLDPGTVERACRPPQFIPLPPGKELPRSGVGPDVDVLLHVWQPRLRQRHPMLPIQNLRHLASLDRVSQLGYRRFFGFLGIHSGLGQGFQTAAVASENLLFEFCPPYGQADLLFCYCDPSVNIHLFLQPFYPIAPQRSTVLTAPANTSHWSFCSASCKAPLSVRW